MCHSIRRSIGADDRELVVLGGVRLEARDVDVITSGPVYVLARTFLCAIIPLKGTRGPLSIGSTLTLRSTSLPRHHSPTSRHLLNPADYVYISAEGHGLHSYFQ